MSPDQELVTQLLQEWGGGSKEALDKIIPLVYEQLHKLAVRYMRDERPYHTLRATALVNEVYVRLVDSNVTWKDRVHFYSVAAKLLRRILVDHARALSSQKRGQRPNKIALDEALFLGPGVDSSVIELDDALKLLASHDQRKSDIVEMLYFGGLTYEETAGALDISESTIHRELKMAKAWLYQELSHHTHTGPRT